MMDKNDLYALDETVYWQIQEEKRKKDAELKAYFDGMEKGAEMMMKSVRDYLQKEKMKGGAE